MALISSFLRLWGVLLTSDILSLLNESFTLVVSVDLILGVRGELLILKWLELYLFEDVVHQLFNLKSFSTRIFLLSTRSWSKKQVMLGKKVWFSPLLFSCKLLDDKSDILFMLGENLESSSLSYDEILLLFDTWRSPISLFLIEIC